MTSIKKRLTFIFCLLLFLGLDRFAGRHLFGEAQMAVEILSIFFAGFFLFYCAISNERVSRNRGPEVDKRKLALLALVRAKEQKRKFKDFMRRKKEGKP